MNTNPVAVAFGVVALSLGVAAQAQMIPAKPGLWASSTVVTINGKPAPTLFNVRGALTEPQVAAIRSAMTRLGLPKNGNPSLVCSTASEVDLQAVMADARARGCAPIVTDRGQDHINFDLACKTPQGNATGKGSVTGINTDRVNYSFVMKGVISGAPVSFESRQVDQFVGPDCQNPPPGIDPKWIRM